MGLYLLHLYIWSQALGKQGFKGKLQRNRPASFVQSPGSPSGQRPTVSLEETQSASAPDASKSAPTSEPGRLGSQGFAGPRMTVPVQMQPLHSSPLFTLVMLLIDSGSKQFLNKGVFSTCLGSWQWLRSSSPHWSVLGRFCNSLVFHVANSEDAVHSTNRFL